MELSHQKPFQRTPQTPRAKERLIIRDQHHLAGISGGMDAVPTAKREDATLNAQALFNDFESQQMRWFTRGDALCQIAAAVCAPDRFTNLGLVALGADWVGQQRAKKEGRAPGNFLIEHDVIPDLFGATIKADPRRDSFIDRFRPTSELTSRDHPAACVPRPGRVGIRSATCSSSFAGNAFRSDFGG